MIPEKTFDVLVSSCIMLAIALVMLWVCFAYDEWKRKIKEKRQHE